MAKGMKFACPKCKEVFVAAPVHPGEEKNITTPCCAVAFRYKRCESGNCTNNTVKSGRVYQGQTKDGSFSYELCSGCAARRELFERNPEDNVGATIATFGPRGMIVWPGVDISRDGKVSVKGDDPGPQSADSTIMRYWTEVTK